MKKNKLEKEIFYLKIYAGFSSLLLLLLIMSSFLEGTKVTNFEEIDVERINIREKNGDLKMVISNKERQHPGISNGKIIERDHPRPPGIIFFNHVGDEMGGLVYGENGPNSHFGSFTWDKFGGDQTIGFRHLESENGSYASGISMWQQPKIGGELMMEKLDSVNKIEDDTQRKQAIRALREAGMLTTHRLFVGKSRNDAAMLGILDHKGQTRLAVMVDTDGTPKILFFDENGEISRSITD